MYKDTYAKFLPHINNNYDFQELSEILGELNASHTGGRYSFTPLYGCYRMFGFAYMMKKCR
jgi:hypothetical protein